MLIEDRAETEALVTQALRIAAVLSDSSTN
jgi:hypothetical protein